MAGKKGIILPLPISQEVSTNISKEIDSYEFVSFPPVVVSDVIEFNLYKNRPLSYYRMPKGHLWNIKGNIFNSFFKDFYFRIYLSPIFIDLSTIASSQTHQIQLWNAYPYTAANLDSINVTNSSGIEITGAEPPFTMYPLAEIAYEVTISVSGPPDINSLIQFDFSDVNNPYPIHIVGTRAVKFDIAPEVPIVETWEWLSDIMISEDGTNQRISLRGEFPRIEQQFKVVFDNIIDMSNIQADLLKMAGRIWLPEYQYATLILQNALTNDNIIYFDPNKTDVRDSEYILLKTNTFSQLVKVSSVLSDSAILDLPLNFDIPKGSLIIPGASCIVEDNTAFSHYAVDEVSELKISAKYIRQRSDLERPGSTATLEYFNGLPVLNRRPLANDNYDNSITTGQKIFDNKTGLLNSVSRWDYSRIGGNRSYKINRISDYSEIDFWKAFFKYTKGRVKTFFLPTYRKDLLLFDLPSDGTSVYKVQGTYYAEKIWSLITHRFVEIETAGGIHRTVVTAASVSEDNQTLLSFEDNVPSGLDWQDVKRISYLLAVTLAEDSIKLEHYGLESILSLSIRTSEF